MSRDDIRERVRAVTDAAQSQRRSLNTQTSSDAARNAASQGLAYLPFLTINDIILLKDAGITNLETLEEKILSVPAPTWDHVVCLIEAGVVRIQPGSLNAAEAEARAAAEADGNMQCLALTKAGTRCRNISRDGSKYCGSHKGYRPSKEELEARELGLLPTA